MSEEEETEMIAYVFAMLIMSINKLCDQYGDEEALRIRGSKTWRLLEEKISREKK